MHVDDLMTDDFPVIAEGASLQQAATLMDQRGIDVLAVRESDRFLGTVSRHDLASGGCGGGHDPRSTAVAEVMSRRIASCPVDADLHTALKRMAEQEVEALFVRAPTDRVIGFLTRLRVLEALAWPDDRPRGPDPEHVRRVRGE